MQQNLHPITVVQHDLITFFIRRGFQVRLFNEIRTLEEEFESVKIYKENPVRDQTRTFYIDETHVLQAHISALRATVEKCGQGRYLIPGRIYRVNREDSSHNYISHQMEGCIVQSKADIMYFHNLMKEAFCQLGFAKEQLRCTTDFTIFTSPTLQYYFRCNLCGGKGCKMCKGKGIIAYAAGGIQENSYRNGRGNISFCISVDRLAMLKYYLIDARKLYLE